MPVLTVYHSGLKMGVAPFPQKNTHARAKRRECRGWTAGASRRNTEFLQSVIPDRLDGHGWAVTLTLRDCPPTAADWQALLLSWIDRVRKMPDFLRLHWVVEWQARGVPHLHACVYLSSRQHRCLVNFWLALAGAYGAAAAGQYIKPVSTTTGWLRYLSKHAARGAGHYQRSQHSLPDGWQSTGRLWGKRGQWPLAEPLKLRIDDRAFWRLRRVVRGLYKAHARAVGNPALIRQARRYLRWPDRRSSAVRGCAAWADGGDVVDALDDILQGGGQLLAESIQWVDPDPDMRHKDWLMLQRVLADDPAAFTRRGRD